MTASERLRELAYNQGGDDVTFTSAEVLVIASLVEAAEHEHPEPHHYWRADAAVNECPTCAALATLSQALEPGK